MYLAAMMRLVVLVLGVICSMNLWAQQSPVLFIENKGQWPDHVKAKAEMPATEVYYERDGFTYVFYDEEVLQTRSLAHTGQIPWSDVPARLKAHAVKFTFEQTQSNTVIQGIEEQPTRFHFLRGNDPKSWGQNARSYAELNYKNLYPGIDMRCYAETAGLKYDLVVAPGSDPSQIKARYRGAQRVSLKNNRLLIQTSVNEWQELEPYVYQEINGRKSAVSCKYTLKDQVIGFELGEYDRKLPLIIDPLLLISTYSGSVADNFGYTATFDSKGFLYSGSSVLTTAPYPTTPGAFDISFNGGSSDYAITKYDTTGTTRIYSTYVGGSDSELPHSLVVDSKDQLIIYGTTGSANYPTTTDAAYRIFRGGPEVNLTQGLGVRYAAGADIFISKLSFDGSTMLASTFFGGSNTDGINQHPSVPNGFLKYNYADEIRGEVIVDDLDQIYIASTTLSTDIPIADNPIQGTYGGRLDGVVAKFNFNLSQVIWASYLGGQGDDALFAVDIDESGDVVVSGGTSSNNLPTTLQAVQPNFGGGRADGFFARINPAGNLLKTLSYWGSTAYDQIYLHEFGPDGSLYLFGQTEDNTGRFYINHTGGFGQPNSGQFISKLTNDGSAVQYSLTFGNGVPRPQISPTAFLVDNCGLIYTAGWGGTLNAAGSNLVNNNAQGVAGMPVKAESNPLFRSNPDQADFHIMVLDQNASQIISGFYFGEQGGNDHVDGGTSRFDKRSQVYHSVCASCGGSSGFPTTPGAVSPTNRGTLSNGQPQGCNNAVFKMDFVSNAVAADFQWDVASCSNDTVYFDNLSDAATQFTWFFGDGSPPVTTAEPAHFYAQPGVYDVKLIARNPGACNTIDSITKRVVVYPIGSKSLPDSLICLKDTIQLGFPTLPGAIYDWSPGIGLSDSTIANPLIFPESGRTYRLVINGFGCLDTTIITTSVDGVLARFNADQSKCEGQAVQFNNQSLLADKYLWNFGDGSFSTDLNPQHTYPEPGEYVVTLYSTTFDPGLVCDAQDSVQKTVVVYPNGSTTLADTLLCKSDSLQLGYDPLPGATYRWFPGSAVSDSTVSNPYLQQYAVSELILVSQGGSCADTLRYRFSSVGVNAQFTTPLNTCDGGPIQFTNTSENGTNYRWTFGDGNTSTAVNPSHLYANSGVYQVRLIADAIVADPRCATSDTIIKTVVVYPNSRRNLGDQVYCLNDVIVIGVAPLPGATYRWVPATNLSSDTVSNPTYLGSTTTSYTLYTSAFGCRDTLQVRIITEGVKADFTFDSSVCQGGRMQFNNTSLLATNYQWTFGDGSLPSTATNPSHVYAQPGTYVVRLIASRSNPGANCSSSDTLFQTVVIYPNRTRNQSATLCRSDSIVLGDAGFPGSDYRWTPTLGLSTPDSSQTLLLPGDPNFYVRIGTAGECLDSLRISLTLNGVKAAFTFTTATCEDDTIRFRNLSSGQELLNWDFGDGTTSTALNPTKKYLNPGTYTVRLIARSTTGNGSCQTSDTATAVLTIYPNKKQVLPPAVICGNDTLQIGTPAVGNSTYQWTPVSGLSDPTAAQPFAYPGTSGVYTRVSVFGSCVDSLEVTLTNEGAKAGFDPSPLRCQNGPISFNNTSVGANQFEWNFGDGGTSTDANPQYTFANPGNY
ncbi:MAG TPA: PKD domain-containing protein, partial [Luteibaculaceae bacterium]|nr:PKD domain-containing protein [Luteibaculaceae bacterium]